VIFPHNPTQSFERLMTFYTPNISSGPPGSFPSVQIVPAEHVPAEPTDVPRKSSLTAGHKKGSMHYMKRDGKDDTSTFVIQEGITLHAIHWLL
jgi:hypothetical protein